MRVFVRARVRMWGVALLAPDATHMGRPYLFVHNIQLYIHETVCLDTHTATNSHFIHSVAVLYTPGINSVQQ